HKNFLETEFLSFKLRHNKLYESKAVELKRLQIFQDNKKLIDLHNQRYEMGKETFKMGVNQFTDLSPSEFRSLMLSTINTT
ncbi:hypothetical protein KR222_010276, partial [Zaprionus bogoriensis]